MPKEILVIDEFYLGQDKSTEEKELLDSESKEQKNLDTIENLATEKKGKVKVLGAFHEVIKQYIYPELNLIDLENYDTTIYDDTEIDPVTKYGSSLFVYGQDYNLDGFPLNPTFMVAPNGLESIRIFDSTVESGTDADDSTSPELTLFSDPDFDGYSFQPGDHAEDSDTGAAFCPIDPVYYIADGALIVSSKRLDCTDEFGLRGPHLPSKFQYIKRNFYEGYTSQFSHEGWEWTKAVPGSPNVGVTGYVPLQISAGTTYSLDSINGIPGRVTLHYDINNDAGGTFSESIATIWVVGISWVKDNFTDTDIYSAVDFMDLSETEFAPAIRISYEHGSTAAWPDPSVTGFKIWFQNQGQGDWYLLSEVSFERAKYYFPANDGGTWDFGLSQHNVIDQNMMTLFNLEENPSSDGGAPPFIRYIPLETYSSVAGRYAGDRIDAMYKTATVINMRTYIGNVLMNGKIFGDRMLKSPHRQYTVFPENNYIDVAINDGDDIIKLESFADRILQFKRNTLYVINVARETEFLEAEFPGYGIDYQSASYKTPHGIGFANKQGFFMFDGERVHNLLKSGVVTKISSKDWEEFTTINIDGIVYNRKLKVCHLSEYNDLHVYNSDSNSGLIDGYKVNINTGAVASLQNRFNASIGSNFSTYNNRTYVAEYDASDSCRIMRWNKIPKMDFQTNPEEVFTLITKNFDFGTPATRKKIYRIYITYKSNQEPNVTLYLSVDGSETFNSGSSVIDSADGTYINSSGQLQNTNGAWKQGWIKPKTTVAGKIYSIQLKLQPHGAGIANVVDFEIDDISIVFRKKQPK